MRIAYVCKLNVQYCILYSWDEIVLQQYIYIWKLSYKVAILQAFHDSHI